MVVAPVFVTTGITSWLVQSLEQMQFIVEASAYTSLAMVMDFGHVDPLCLFTADQK